MERFVWLVMKVIIFNESYQKPLVSLIIVIGVIFSLLSLNSISKQWSSHLYDPTYITKIQDTYFIVDCSHHRVIYSDSIKKPIFSWDVLIEGDCNVPHSVAGNGRVILVDDTLNDRVIAFENINGKYQRYRTFDLNDESWPHYTYYDDETELFYTIEAKGYAVDIFKDVGNDLAFVEHHCITEMNDYTRSFSIVEGYMYLVSGGGKILKLDYKNDFQLIDEYIVPEELVGENFLYKIGDYWYISSYTSSDGIDPDIIVTESLEKLANRQYKSVYKIMDMESVPYYISSFDNKYWIGEIEHVPDVGQYYENCIVSFDVDQNGNPFNIKKHFRTYSHSSESEEVYQKETK